MGCASVGVGEGGMMAGAPGMELPRTVRMSWIDSSVLAIFSFFLILARM